jgi:hypothetical protein
MEEMRPIRTPDHLSSPALLDQTEGRPRQPDERDDRERDDEGLDHQPRMATQPVFDVIVVGGFTASAAREPGDDRGERLDRLREDGHIGNPPPRTALPQDLDDAVLAPDQCVR